MFTFSEMLALVQSESSFGAYVCHRRPAGLHSDQRSCLPQVNSSVHVCRITFFRDRSLCVQDVLKRRFGDKKIITHCTSHTLHSSTCLELVLLQDVLRKTFTAPQQIDKLNANVLKTKKKKQVCRRSQLPVETSEDLLVVLMFFFLQIFGIY